MQETIKGTLSALHEAEQYLRKSDTPYHLYVDYKGSKRKLFLNKKDGIIGIINKGCKKQGIYFNDWSGITRLYIGEQVKQDAKKIRRRLVQKYKKEAQKATFTNPFIRACLVADGNKNCYENNLSTGCCVEGKIITLDSISKYYSCEAQHFLRALNEKSEYSSKRFKFRGYECTLSIGVPKEEGDNYFEEGDVMGYFSMEFKDCANGYYYLLINDEKFIGYDKD